MTYLYQTASAARAEERMRGRIRVCNDSFSVRLTMSAIEAASLQRRFFLDIEDVIPDSLMHKLLHHFRDDGLLIDEQTGDRV